MKCFTFLHRNTFSKYLKTLRALRMLQKAFSSLSLSLFFKNNKRNVFSGISRNTVGARGLGNLVAQQFHQGPRFPIRRHFLSLPCLNSSEEMIMSEISRDVVIFSDLHLDFTKASSCLLPSPPFPLLGPHKSLKHCIYFAQHLFPWLQRSRDPGRDRGYEAGLYSFSESSKYGGFQRS